LPEQTTKPNVPRPIKRSMRFHDHNGTLRVYAVELWEGYIELWDHPEGGPPRIWLKSSDLPGVFRGARRLQLGGPWWRVWYWWRRRYWNGRGYRQ